MDNMEIERLFFGFDYYVVHAVYYYDHDQLEN
jgi:hypothetical protein